jgi:hypothetical protein
MIKSGQRQMRIFVCGAANGAGCPCQIGLIDPAYRQQLAELLEALRDEIDVFLDKTETM